MEQLDFKQVHVDHLHEIAERLPVVEKMYEAYTSPVTYSALNSVFTNIQNVK